MNDIPLWLFAEDIHGRRMFVVHSQIPRFIAEFDEDENGYYGGEVLQWIDQPREETPGDLAATVARLINEAASALAEYDEKLIKDAGDVDDLN